MVKKISNFSIIAWTIIILLIIVVSYSFYKITEEKNNKMIFSMEENIKYYAKRCYLEGKCKDTITLGDLYTLDYLDEVINPVTKEIVDKNTKISYVDKQIIIDWEK